MLFVDWWCPVFRLETSLADCPLTLLETQFQASGFTQALDRPTGNGRFEMFGRLFSSLPAKFQWNPCCCRPVSCNCVVKRIDHIYISHFPLLTTATNDMHKMKRVEIVRMWMSWRLCGWGLHSEVGSRFASQKKWVLTLELCTYVNSRSYMNYRYAVYNFQIRSQNFGQKEIQKQVIRIRFELPLW